MQKTEGVYLLAALMKINEVAKKYNITKRTLRYYEEIGLLKTVRIGTAQSRYFDENAINRLEQILLLRSIKFSIKDISLVLLSDNTDTVFDVFSNRLNEVNEKIEELSYINAVISSFIKIGKSAGVAKVNIYQLLKDQIYINNRNERMIDMEKSYEGDIIRLEFGKGIVQYVDPKEGGKLIPNIKELRKALEEENLKEIPLVRVMDNLKLGELQYRISIKGKVLVDNSLVSVSPEERIPDMLSNLEKAIKSNIGDILN
jgi:Predicted transcriptional regulators